MKAWRLAYNNMMLEVLDIDDVTREIRKTDKLKLNKPMTSQDAQRYVDSHYPHPATGRTGT